VILIKWLYEKVTGTPWTTVRSCTQEFGPTPGARYEAELRMLSDKQLMELTPGSAVRFGEAVRAARTTPRVAEEPARAA